MSLRFHFVDEDALAADSALAGRLAARLAADPPFPDFTVLTPAYLAALPSEAAPMGMVPEVAPRGIVPMPTVDEADAGSAVTLYTGSLDALPEWAAAALAAGWTAAVVVPAPRARMPALTEALRPRLYLSHPYRSLGELRSFANQLAGDGILFSEYSAVRLPLVARPTRFGRFLRGMVIRWILRPLGLW